MADLARRLRRLRILAMRHEVAMRQAASAAAKAAESLAEAHRLGQDLAGLGAHYRALEGAAGLSAQSLHGIRVKLGQLAVANQEHAAQLGVLVKEREQADAALREARARGTRVQELVEACRRAQWAEREQRLAAVQEQPRGDVRDGHWD